MSDLERALRAAGSVEVDAAAITAGFVRQAEEAALIDVAYTVVDSPLGALLLAATRRGLVRVAFEEDDGALPGLAELLSPRLLEVPERLAGFRSQLDEYFTGTRTSFDLPVDRTLIRGFRSPVLRVTSTIPYGDVASYGEVARRVGRPRAARAVGQALRGNPLPIVIPCHRVVRTGGEAGGYAGGSERKQHLLRLEAGRR